MERGFRSWTSQLYHFILHKTRLFTKANFLRLTQALDLMHNWSLIDVDDALELLSPQFTNPAVRIYAVSRLREANDEVCYCMT